MHLAELRLRDFRNYPRLDARFSPGFHLLVGDNAQGKTNLLEALYLIATLRSFRGVGGTQMVRHGQKGYFIGATIVGQTQRQIRIYWSAAERRLSLDGHPVRRLTDYLGTLRAVVFCSEDVQLIKGSARARRRFLDLLLSQTAPTYLPVLQRYMRTLRSRNALLRHPHADEAALEGFSQELIRAGHALLEQRSSLVPKLEPLARAAFRRVCRESEDLSLDYRPGVKSDFAVELAQSRKREQAFRTTLVGPHRDEVLLLINGRSAAQFGSEGQKRSLAIALKIAQAEYVSAVHGAPPVLLIDDVMGELDRHRRSGFLPLLESAHQGRGQVFMTCTEENWPRDLTGQARRWVIRDGRLG